MKQEWTHFTQKYKQTNSYSPPVDGFLALPDFHHLTFDPQGSVPDDDGVKMCHYPARGAQCGSLWKGEQILEESLSYYPDMQDA